MIIKIKELFTEKDKIIRMGMPPVRIKVIIDAPGVEFDECYSRREICQIDGIPVISLDNLKLNKRTAGKHKDLDDLEHIS